jgi:UDP-glucose 4-epimerase
MRALVTGGAGFIGSHVVDHLLAAGHEVGVLDDLSGGFLENVSMDARVFQGSVTDEKYVEHLFSEHKFDYVYHLAAYAAEGLSHFIRNYNYTNNVIGSVNIINACVRNDVKCLVFTSSIAVYGSGQVPMTEDMTPAPEDPYGIAKYAVEMDLAAAHRQFGLPYIIFRPHNVYGERQNIGDPYRNVIGIWMNQILKGEPMTIFGDGRQTRAFTHIDDVAPLIAKAPEIQEAYQQVFNIGANEPYTVNELAVAVAWSMGKLANDVGMNRLPERKEVKYAFSDHSKVQRVFRQESTLNLDYGLKRMAEWVKQHGSRQTKPFFNLELENGLPPSWTKAREQVLS